MLQKLLLTIMLATVSVADQTVTDQTMTDKSADKEPIVNDKKVQFARDVQPIFTKHCHSCHGANKQENNFRLDRKTDAFTGGDHGASIIPGDSEKSYLLQLINGDDPDILMPPKGNLLSEKQIATIKKWIDEGANWPDKKKKRKQRNK